MTTETTDHATPHHHRTPAEQGYNFSEQVGHLLRKAYQRHTSIFQRHSCDKQLTAIQFVTLCTVMEQGASSLTDIVKLNLYLVDLDNFAIVNRVMEEFFKAPFPARAAVGVRALPKGSQVEAEAVMVIGD